MNLPTSSTSSDRSAKQAKPRSAKASRIGGKGGRDDLDLSLKLRAAAALAASGYYCKLNVALSAVTGRGLGDVTDVDVLGIRHDLGFSNLIVAVSCKSGEARSLSPGKEIFYLRGVLDYLHAHDGVILFERRAIPPHLRDLGRQLEIMVLSGDEVEAWLRALMNGIADPQYFSQAGYFKFAEALNKPQVQTLTNYIETDFWFHRDFRNLQNLVGHFRKLNNVLDGSVEWHWAIVYEGAAHLSLTVLELCRSIQLIGRSGLEEATSAYLFGGMTSFKARRDLYARVHQLLSATGIVTQSGPHLPPLEPNYTSTLSELVVRYLDRPHAACRIPQVLQEQLWVKLGAKGLPDNPDKNSLAAGKLAEDLLQFLRSAAGMKWSPEVQF
jgi:hypothetical protein